MCKIFCLWYDRDCKRGKEDSWTWSNSDNCFWETIDSNSYDGERFEKWEGFSDS